MTMQIIQRYENGIRVESGFRDDYEPGDHVYLTGPGNLLRGPYDDRLWRNGEEVRKTTRIETLLLCAGAFTAAATIAAAVALAAVWWLSTPAKADTVVLSGEGTVQVQQDGAVIGVYPIANSPTVEVDFSDPTAMLTVANVVFSDPVVSEPNTGADDAELALTMVGTFDDAPALFTAFEIEGVPNVPSLDEVGVGFNIALLSAASLPPIDVAPATPEASTLAMLAIGFAGLVFARRKNRNAGRIAHALAA